MLKFLRCKGKKKCGNYQRLPGINISSKINASTLLHVVDIEE